jgi:beta-galactosidase
MAILRNIALIILLLASFSTFSQVATHTFTAEGLDFKLDGKPFQIIAGEMHYQRIPREYWQNRLQTAHAMGINAVSVYCFWNDHELKPGEFDFKTGNRDLATFVKMAQAEGLWVILRPGPYACAEWEFGGYPWWLLKEKDMVVRSKDSRFIAAAEKYITEISNQVLDLQVTKGGPIILVQVENEYGSYGNDKEYLGVIRDMFVKAGFNVPLFTADGPVQCKDGYIPGVLPAINGETNPDALMDTVNKYHNGSGPYFIPEYYPGWLDHWGEPKSKVKTDDIVKDIKKLLESGVSFNFYMLHGGTNFGFMNGANYNNEFPIQPDITSYDYDSPINEAGWPTEKYFALKRLIFPFLPEGTIIPEVPERMPVITIPQIRLSEVYSLTNYLPKPIKSPNILTMEDVDQGYGYILYRTTVSKPVKSLLKIKELRDYAIVMINGKPVGTLDRRLRQDSIEIEIKTPNSRLEILVENMGRINYGRKLTDNRKGITEKVLIGKTELKNWEIFPLPVNKIPVYSKVEKKKPVGPVYRRGTFTLEKTGDTFIDMSLWGKGNVFINGYNLGRYWSIGPQQTLYCPAPYLKIGTNEIVIVELLNPEINLVRCLGEPVLDVLKSK